MDLKEFLNRPAASLARRTGRVLVVDDSKTTRNIVLKLLDSIGISDVLDRESASDAFEILQQQRIGLVIADVEMLPISGLDLLKAIRANPRTTKVPVVLMTASYDPRHRSGTLPCGGLRRAEQRIQDPHIRDCVLDRPAECFLAANRAGEGLPL